MAVAIHWLTSLIGNNPGISWPNVAIIGLSLGTHATQKGFILHWETPEDPVQASFLSNITFYLQNHSLMTLGIAVSKSLLPNDFTSGIVRWSAGKNRPKTLAIWEHILSNKATRETWSVPELSMQS